MSINHRKGNPPSSHVGLSQEHCKNLDKEYKIGWLMLIIDNYLVVIRLAAIIIDSLLGKVFVELKQVLVEIIDIFE